MSSEAPTASWHPAMMPHRESDLATSLEIPEASGAADPGPEAAQPVQTQAPTALHNVDTFEAQDSGADDWFPDYEAGSPWQADKPAQEQPLALTSQREDATVDEAAPEFSSEPPFKPDLAPEETTQVAQAEESAPANVFDAAPVANDAPTSAEVQQQPQDFTNEHTQASFGPKHVSNDSFARTVSHQPEFDDEDLWSPRQSEDDPFRFMPPNDRTNSFPVVPRLESREHEQIEPLPTIQAEDIVNEVEQQTESLDLDSGFTTQTDNPLQQDQFWGNGDGEADFPAQLGGDLQGLDAQASEARYEEGVPLISHDQDMAIQHHDTVIEDPDKAHAHDIFGEDDTAEEGDNFFAQIGGQEDNGAEGHDFVPSHLERKSTLQVIQGLETSNNSTQASVLESPLEEEEEEEEEEEDQELLGETLGETPIAEQKAPLETEGLAAETETATQASDVAKPPGEDLAAKWSQAFAEDDDDDFLLEDDSDAENKQSQGFDASAFLGDDDDGLLDDIDDLPQTAQAEQPAPSVHQPPPPSRTTSSARYLPTEATPLVSTQPINSYFPSPSPVVLAAQTFSAIPPAATNPYAYQAPSQLAATPYGAPAARPPANKAQSFADKSKGGYSSPYDLPMEVVKPKKRATHQQQPRGITTAPPPPPPPAAAPGPPAPLRSLSGSTPSQVPPPTSVPAPIQGSIPGVSPPTPIHSGQSPSLSRPHQLSSKSSFFEELPSSAKTRPASRTASHTGQPSPHLASLGGPPQATQPQPHPTSIPTPPQAPSMAGASVASDIPRLVPPPPANPYANLPTAATSAPSVLPPPAQRYSPASSQGTAATGAAPPPSRYSPAPLGQRTLSHGPAVAATPPPTAAPVAQALPHLPRTSSPLAHFEARPAEMQSMPALQPSRSSSSLFEPRLNRMPSLPPTREVEEDDATAQPASGAPPPHASQLPTRTRQHIQPPMSPPKRKISYGPAPTAHDFVPPARSQTGSPGAMYGLRSPIKASEIGPRPSSAQGPSPPSIDGAMSSFTTTRPRGMSQKLNLIPPTDGREHDPLERWKGVPLISWGAGGMLVTSFPVDVPRYGMNQPGPMIVRSPGEIKVKTMKDVQPLEERLSKFPGPLRGKSKKKETVSWLSAGIEELEKGLPNLQFQTPQSHEEKRAVERVLLWKILRVMIENDGLLEGNEVVDKAVRDVLSESSTDEVDSEPPAIHSDASFGIGGDLAATNQIQSDAVDAGTMQRIKKSLLAGDREKAVWDAADKRLWGHALLIANTVSPDLYHKVSQEFIKKEVNFPGHNNESLAALYSVLSGNHEESVDELVPMHARAGVQLVASSAGVTNAAGLGGLEKWRETATLVLSNRSTGDAQALNSLGNLLSGYGRAEAAHICFIFARSATVFGGLDDPRVQFVLVGADHKTQSQQFFKETEALLLSEVYEYGLTLTGTPSVAYGVPHLSVYKLQHAITLAEHGFRDKALQYCDVILKDMTAQTKRSPYHHVLLESRVEDLRQRMLQAPGKEASGSWISKPSMGKVSDSMWNRFNKFVAGDDTDANGQGSPKFGEESGPFAQIQGGTPTISRPPSASNATGMEMFGSSPNGYALGTSSLAPPVSPVVARTSSRYAPAAASSTGSPYDPNPAYTPSGHTSGDYNSSPYEPRRASSDMPLAPTRSYMPNNAAAAAASPGYSDPALGLAISSPYQPVPPALPLSSTASAPTPAESSGPRTPGFSPYTPLSQQAPLPNSSSPYTPLAAEPEAKATSESQSYGYEQPSFSNTQEQPVESIVEPASSRGYEPPTFQTYGYEPPSLSTGQDEPAKAAEEPISSGGYEPPTFQPYGYEPPSYDLSSAPNANETDDDDMPKPKKKSFMDDDDGDDYPAMASKVAEKSKAEKDRENEELFRKAAEEDAKRAAEEKAAKSKKGWGFGGWFGGGGAGAGAGSSNGGGSSKKDSLDSSSPNKPIRAKLGEKSSFVYDPDQKRWVNKAAGAEDTAPKSATPPPPRALSRPPIPGPANSAPPPLRSGSTPTPPLGGASTPPLPGTGGFGGPPASGTSTPPLMRSASMATVGGTQSAPPSRPATSMSTASSIDDLLGAATPRKGARGKKKGGGRYVDVMAK
ncbi:Sec23-binding domain of Sec16-domain-containing protein [Coniella lustricola]|uniref:Protein transport protein sec16 n=1 Tax=Coniella lustricola TaxID=2025994 RepID=A0A2T3AJR2_9PEZI|nr:Sec23-binding domain of Sec16-domain-containing protein [Coniella lustricola]